MSTLDWQSRGIQMLLGEGSTVREVSAELLFRRTESYYKLKKQRNTLVDFNQKLLFIELKCLSEFEARFTARSNGSPVPFHNLLARCSERYQKIDAIRGELKIPLVPCFKSIHRFSMEFNPFKGYTETPIIRDELQYLLRHPLSGSLHKQLLGLLSFNFAVYHEQLHAIFYRLIPGPRRGPLTDYFRFIEALVFAQEYYLARELGQTISIPLANISSTYRPFVKERIIGVEIKDPKTVFLGLLATNLAFMCQWPRERRAIDLPSYAPNIASKNVGFQRVFTHETSARWVKENSKRVYPEWLRKKKAGKRQKFQIDDFSIGKILSNRHQLEEFWHWHRELFAL